MMTDFSETRPGRAFRPFHLALLGFGLIAGFKFAGWLAAAFTAHLNSILK